MSRKNINMEIIDATRDGDVAGIHDALARGADINAVDKHEWTAVMWAAYDGRHDCLTALIAAGADVNRTDNCGRTAVMLAKHDVKQDCLTALIAAGANIDTTDKYGCTLAMRAAVKGHHDVVTILIAAGVDIEQKDNDGRSTLDIIQKNGWSDALAAWESRKFKESTAVRHQERSMNDGIGL